MMKPLFILTGTLAMTLGITGIFLPVLPSTPFFILAAGLYVKSSPRLYEKMSSHPVIRKYLYNTKGNYNPYMLTAAIIIMWVTILLTFFFITENLFLKTILIAAGIAGSFFKGRLIFRQFKRNTQTDINKTRQISGFTDNYKSL